MPIVSHRMASFFMICAANILALGCSAEKHAARPLDTRSDGEKIAPLMSVVKENGVSVWVEYSGLCISDVSEDIPLDLGIRRDKENGKGDALSAVQGMVQDNAGIAVSQLRPGTIGIKSDNLWSPVLQAKLIDLKLKDIDRYNPNVAISDGINASFASLPALRGRPNLKFAEGLLEEPSRQRPHLKAAAKYQTLENLLDDVVGTFGGILVYKECRRTDGTHIFDIDFYRKD